MWHEVSGLRADDSSIWKYAIKGICLSNYIILIGANLDAGSTTPPPLRRDVEFNIVLVAAVSRNSAESIAE